MNYKLYSNYAERLFYYFKRLFILLIVGQVVCIIAIEDDATLTKIFFISLIFVLLVSVVLEHVKRKTFPKVEITDNKIYIQVGRDSFNLTPDKVVKVYCDVVFSINHLPLSYDKGIIFNIGADQIKLYLNKLSVNKVTTIQSIVEFHKLQLVENKNTLYNPIIIENRSLRPIMAVCIGVLVVFWSLIGYVVAQQEVYIGKLLQCVGACIAMIIPMLLVYSNSLVKIEYKGKLYLTTFLGKRIEMISRDISRIDTQKTSRAGDSRVRYLNIYLKNGKHKEYKILLSVDEDRVKFHELSKYLMGENTNPDLQ